MHVHISEILQSTDISNKFQQRRFEHQKSTFWRHVSYQCVLVQFDASRELTACQTSQSALSQTFHQMFTSLQNLQASPLTKKRSIFGIKTFAEKHFRFQSLHGTAHNKIDLVMQLARKLL